MIQRVQTLYLLLASLFTGLMLWFPLGYFLADGQEFRLMAFGLTDLSQPEGGFVVGTATMGVLIVAATLLPAVNILFYKNRMLQARLCLAEMVLLIGTLAFVAFFSYRAFRSVEIFVNHSMKLAIAAIFPVVAIILTWLAYRAILKDELLVRSVNRIR